MLSFAFDVFQEVLLAPLEVRMVKLHILRLRLDGARRDIHHLAETI